MSSPIPTQLSPGVKVSEIDLSTFVQPEALNSAGMVGTFNWGPSLVARRVTSESDLASVFGKPTLDPSDTLSESDFFAAANFLKYSNNLKVIRVSQTDDKNATSVDAGINSIADCTYPLIKDEEEFAGLGGLSGYDGIEPIAHFRARYPGNFGNTLKVVVWDGATGTSATTTSTSGYIDYALRGGYSTANVLGITTGSIGYTFSAYIADISDFGAGAGGFIVAGTTSGTHEYFLVTVVPPNNKTPAQFISELKTRTKFNCIYATGTTSANATLSASDPSGNRENYYVLEDVTTEGLAFNPFLLGSQNAATLLFAKAASGATAVDIMFLNADSTNMHPTWVIGGADFQFIAKFDDFITNGVPSNFGQLIYNQTNFLQYRDQISKVSDRIFNAVTGTPSTTLKGWSLLVGLTGGITFCKSINGTQTAFGVTFDSVGGATGVRRDFSFGMKQLGYLGTYTTTQGGNNDTFSNVALFDKTPNTSDFVEGKGGSNDELSVAIVDTNGKFGPKNSVLEKFELLSKAIDAKNLDGESIYYKDYINSNSQYVYLTKTFGLSGGGTPSSDSTTTFGDIVQTYLVGGITYARKGYYETQMAFGQSGVTGISTAEYTEAYKLFADDDYAVDILFVPESSLPNDSAKTNTVTENIAYDTVIEPRKDTILVLPTPKPTSITQHTGQTTTNTIKFRNESLGVPSNSYTILVAGRKLFFDTFNNQIRKMSLSSDVAGILSAQEIAWESPAGFDRGVLKNSIRLETNFTKANRDDLYKNNINFFLQFSDGSGTALFGDKTMLTKPSAFDRINVRRVFIALEKSIAKAAKYSLFEFNDEFTRSQFRNLVTPFLRSVQSQRGITDFKVVCDSTNNTPEVIDKNQFVADIYIKPNKSINFIQLNFIAVRSDFTFSTTE